ncbi:MAG: hypothetical protein K5907_02375 [Treponema sp.]|nr:hypothetical protein [Treponema sp.]
MQNQIVIVPHPTEELLLIKLQKKLIRQFFTSDGLIFACQPLWIPSVFETVEAAKAEITQITLQNPEFDSDKNQIFCPVKIQSKNKADKLCDQTSTLPLVQFENATAPAAPMLKKEELFPLSLKIFRLGESSSPCNGLHELTAAVWKKLSR